MEALSNADAASFCNVLDATMDKHGLKDRKRRLVGLGTDGCSTMRGRTS